MTANPLPASFLRGGTSKGIFLHRRDLPEDLNDWKSVLLGIMGSPDPEHGRQLNGMGGGVSSLSKVCVVGPPDDDQKAQGIDVVYTFVQVGIRDDVLDISGNCGNLSSMIGVFAIDEGICGVSPRTDDTAPRTERVALDAPNALAAATVTVRSLNTNTNKIIDTTFPVSSLEGKIVPLLDLPQATVAGVPGKASQIILEFVDPGGARTGRLLPSGEPTDVIEVETSPGTNASLRVSLVDATNPTVFVSQTDLCRALGLLPPRNEHEHGGDASPSPIVVDYDDPAVRALMEAVRQAGARRMGLDPTAQAQPKVAALSAPSKGDTSTADVVVRAFSMGVPHKAVPMTVGLCLGVASGVRGTLAWELVHATRRARGDYQPALGDLITMRHPGGTVEVGASFDSEGRVTSAKVVRTGRRLMKGVVWW